MTFLRWESAGLLFCGVYLPRSGGRRGGKACRGGLGYFGFILWSAWFLFGTGGGGLAVLGSGFRACYYGEGAGLVELVSPVAPGGPSRNGCGVWG